MIIVSGRYLVKGMLEKNGKKESLNEEFVFDEGFDGVTNEIRKRLGLDEKDKSSRFIISYSILYLGPIEEPEPIKEMIDDDSISDRDEGQEEDA